MKVLHVIPAIAARYGGPSAATVGMCRALSAVGVSTLVVTTDADGPDRLPVELGRPTEFEGVAAIFFRRQVSEAFKWSKPLGDWLNSHVREFDVVHIHAVFSHSSIAAGRACRADAIPYIVRPLGTLDPWSVSQKRFRKRVLFRLGVHDLLAGASAMHYTSDEERRLAEVVVPRLPSGEVVPLGIDDRYFEVRATDRADLSPFALSLSRVHEKKGLELLIRAFHAIASDDSLRNWRLVIAGDGEPAYVSTLKMLAEGGPARARIEFPGWVGGADKMRLLSGARLMVSASHQENFGIAIVEAMACGVPALVTPGVNLAAEIQEAGAGWVAGRDDEGFTGALSRAMGNLDELDRRGRHARIFAGQFQWPAVAERLRAMYESAAARRPRASRTA